MAVGGMWPPIGAAVAATRPAAVTGSRGRPEPDARPVGPDRLDR